MQNTLHPRTTTIGSKWVSTFPWLQGQLALLIGLSLPLWPSLLGAQGRVDVDGAPVCTAPGAQSIPRIVTDGAGGAIIAWDDFRSGDTDIYVQHVRASGAVDHAWPINGLAVCTAPGAQAEHQIVSDGTGGAIVVWTDQRSLYDLNIYAQHVLASGIVDPVWPADGLAVCAAPNEQSSPLIVTDGAGGAIVAWADARSGTYDVYAQHVRASGTADPTWPADGIALCTAHAFRVPEAMLPDGMGGAFVAWSLLLDEQTDTYAQHVLASGEVDPIWPAEGLALATGPREQGNAVMVTDGSRGALVTWDSAYRGEDGAYVDEIFAHHLTASGLDPTWPARGLLIPGARGGEIIPDGSGGAFGVWSDTRSGQYYEIYAQHLLGSAMVDPTWPVDGLPVVTGPPGNRIDASMVPDGTGGAILVWNEPGQDDYWDIRAHHLTATGLDPTWPTLGRPVSTAPLSQDQLAIVAGAPGQAIIAWRDYRHGTSNADIYARRINIHSHGASGSAEPIGKLALDRPQASPAGRGVTILFEVPVEEPVSVEVFDVAGRAVRTLAAREDFAPGTHTLAWDGTDRSGVPLKRGVYLVRLSTEGESLTRKFVVLP